MSWSQSASGSAQQVLDTIGQWKEIVAKNDATASASQAVKDGHGAQVDRCVKTITYFVEGAPDQQFSVTGGGHAGQTEQDGPLTSDSIWLSLNQQLPATPSA